MGGSIAFWVLAAALLVEDFVLWRLNLAVLPVWLSWQRRPVLVLLLLHHR